MTRFLQKKFFLFSFTFFVCLNFFINPLVFAQTDVNLSQVTLSISPNVNITTGQRLIFTVSGIPNGALVCVQESTVGSTCPPSSSITDGSVQFNWNAPRTVGSHTYQVKINGQLTQNGNTQITVNEPVTTSEPDPVIPVTPYTGTPPPGVGGVDTPGFCGGDPNLVWDSKAKMCFPKSDPCTPGSLACSGSLSELIIKVINYLLIFAGMIAVLAIVIGGFWYITAAGNEEQSEKGKKALINAIIGIVIVSLAFVIVRVISHTLTSGSV